MANQERCGHIICFSPINPGDFSFSGQINGLSPTGIESRPSDNGSSTRFDISFPVLQIYKSEGCLDGWLEAAQNILGNRYGYYTEDPS